jgi:hypothetical protein
MMVVVVVQVQSAEMTFDEMVADHDLRVLAFTDYGREAVKGFGLSPDAWCQMAIQLAYYRCACACVFVRVQFDSCGLWRGR